VEHAPDSVLCILRSARGAQLLALGHQHRHELGKSFADGLELANEGENGEHQGGNVLQVEQRNQVADDVLVQEVRREDEGENFQQVQASLPCVLRVQVQLFHQIRVTDALLNVTNKNLKKNQYINLTGFFYAYFGFQKYDWWSFLKPKTLNTKFRTIIFDGKITNFQTIVVKGKNHLDSIVIDHDGRSSF